jgi:transcriptional regulator with XRE-family HTH domain
MASVHPLSFAILLRRHRRTTGLSQEELAQRAGLSRRAVSDLERASSRIPRKDTVELLAEALGLAPQERTLFFLAATHQRPMQGSASDRAAPGSSTPPHQVTLPPLVGRADELALLERHLRGQGPAALLLAGEPGIGKTRLLRETAPRARASGWCVLEGGCHRRDAQGPYAPLLGALAAYLGERTPPQLRTDLQGCAWLVRLLPELAETAVVPLPEWTLPPEQERRLMFAAVGRFLVNVAGPAGTLLVLDDLQWAGEDGLDLLATLLREPSTPPVRIVGAYRATEVHPGDALSGLLVDLAHEEGLWQAPIGALAGSEAAELLRAILKGGEDPSVIERLLQRSGGIPFFLVSCARALRVGALGGATAADVPWDAAESIRLRVAALPAPAQQLLRVAAVVGRTVPRALVAGVLARPEEEVLTLAEASCAARLLLESDTETYEFAHDLIREAVEGDLSAGRRRLLHRRVAEALDQSKNLAAPEVIAYHYEQGGVPKKAVAYLEQAAAQAQGSGAFLEAHHHMQHALDLAPLQDQLRLNEQLGDYATYGEVAVEGYQHALLQWRQTTAGASEHPSELLTGARLLRKLVMCYQRTALVLPVPPSEEELATLAAEMLQLAEAAGDEDELWRARNASLWCLQGSTSLTAEDRDAQRTVALSAAAYFEARENWVAYSQAIRVYIEVNREAGTLTEAVEAARHWLAISDLPLAERGEAFASMVSMCEMLGDYLTSIETARQILTHIRPGEPIIHLNGGFGHAAIAAWLSGSWSEHAEIMAVIQQVWEQVQHSPTMVNLLGGYQSALYIALAREDRVAVEALVLELERILSLQWRGGNRALITAHIHDAPEQLDLSLPLADLPMLTAITLMFLSERDHIAPHEYLTAARAQAQLAHWDAPYRCVGIAEALAAGNNTQLASAIDEAELHGLVPHAARMRIVLAERSGDQSYLERARPVLERLGDRLFLRRLKAVAAKLSRV